MKNPTFTVIIPLKKCNSYVRECVTALLSGSYQDFEVIILPDKKEKVTYDKTRIVPSGPVGPAEKRDLGAKLAKGEIVAFIDDDAYPSYDWLKNAYAIFSQKKYAAVCGPGVTPPGDSIFQKVSGAFSASILGGGPYAYRFIPQNAREVDDYPSMNFLIQRSVFEKIGGFDSAFWPGEDTKLCLDVTKKFHEKIWYDPSVLVYHHRRAIFASHLRQNGRYGLHRGHFARILPDTSFRISYFIPSLLLIGFLIAPVLYLINHVLFSIDAFFIALYLGVVIGNSLLSFLQEKNVMIALLLIPTTIATHLFYGVRFIQGFVFTPVLTSKLRS